MNAVRAKMRCSYTQVMQYGPDESNKQLKVQLGAIYGTEGENKDFADATPCGECWMQISPGRPAQEFFKPGKTYYVTFTEAPE